MNNLIATNNPLNLTDAKFARPQQGIAAAVRLLGDLQNTSPNLAYVLRHFGVEVTDDRIEDTAWRAGVDKDRVLNLRDPGTVQRVLDAISIAINGEPDGNRMSWYGPNVWTEGLRLAGLVVSKPLPQSRTLRGVGATLVGVMLMGIGMMAQVPDQAAAYTQQLEPVLGPYAAIGGLVLALIGVGTAIYARLNGKAEGRL